MATVSVCSTREAHAHARASQPPPPRPSPSSVSTLFLSDFTDSDEDEDSEEESEEESDEEEAAEDPNAVPEDLALLLRVCAPLLRSSNSGVVLAVAQVFSNVGAHETTMLPKVGRALVRITRSYREIQYVVLSNIVLLARSTPDMFRPFIRSFFAAESEASFVRRMKVDVLAALVDAETSAPILREFSRYVKDDNKDFVRHTIQAVVRLANAQPDVADKCLRGLMGLVASGSNEVVAEAVVAIRQLVQQHTHHDALVLRLVKRLDKITSPSARAAIVWVLGEFQAQPKIAAIAPDTLRVLAKSFTSEAGEVKAQIVNLAAKVNLRQGAAVPAVGLLFAYVLDLARFDDDYDLRDRARLMRYLVLGTEVTQLAADTLEEAGAAIAIPRHRPTGTEDELSGEVTAAAEASARAAAEAAAEGGDASAAAAAEQTPRGASPVGGAASSADAPSAAAERPRASSGEPAVARLQDRVAAVLLAAKPPPLIASALETSGYANFSMGSLSSIVGHAAKGYMAIPPWAAANTPASLRDPPASDDEDDRPAARRKGAARVESSDDDDDEGASAND